MSDADLGAHVNMMLATVFWTATIAFPILVALCFVYAVFHLWKERND